MPGFKIVCVTIIILTISSDVVFSQLNIDKLNAYIEEKNNPRKFFYDIGFGLGLSKQGYSGSMVLNLAYKKLLIEPRVITYGIMLAGERINEQSILIGLRTRNKSTLFSVAAGFANANYKCTSGMNLNCYNYEEGNFPGTAILLGVDHVKSKSFAYGFHLNFLINKRDPTIAVMFILKSGVF